MTDQTNLTWTCQDSHRIQVRWEIKGTVEETTSGCGGVNNCRLASGQEWAGELDYLNGDDLGFFCTAGLEAAEEGCVQTCEARVAAVHLRDREQMQGTNMVRMWTLCLEY